VHSASNYREQRLRAAMSLEWWQWVLAGAGLLGWLIWLKK
jgi:hypothetical protein